MKKYLAEPSYYINGTWQPQAEGRLVAVADPSTGRVLATITLATDHEVDLAVSAADDAQGPWKNRPVSERIAYMERLLTIYQARSDEMAWAICREVGAPIDFARNQQVPSGQWHIEGYLEAIKDFPFEEPLHPGASETIIREPVGVCGLITPWNWPMNQIVLKVAAALLVGCAVVLKPSELTPLSAMLLAEFIDEAGFPAGVFNLIDGDGAGAGSALSTHPGIDMLSFTGSTRGGIAVGTAAAKRVKRCTLELGGKFPNLIFADADVPAAVVAGVRLCMENTGQSCNAPTRMLIERPVYDHAVALAAQTANSITVAPAGQPGAHIGPLISRAQYDTVQRYIHLGQQEGARLVAGGSGHPAGLTQGHFARPTVFADVTNDMQIAQGEIFGPVLVMIPFDTEDQAVAMANASPYGLSAYLSTSDAERAKRLSRQLRAGMISVNNAGFAKGSPFGGVGFSGIGRESGRFGLEDFTEIKTIASQPA